MDDQADTWASRWRVLRGSPPGPPGDDEFTFLQGLPVAVLEEIAASSDEDKEVLRWWQEIAADPARAELAMLRSSLIDVYRAVRDHGPVTDEDLVRVLQRSIRRVAPRRNDLVKIGLVHEVGRTTPEVGSPAKLWAIVPHDDIVGARAAAAQRGPRRRHLDTYSLDEQLQIVRYLIRKPEVNQTLLADQSKVSAAQHLRREARAAQREEELRRREWNSRIKQAERDASPDLNFLKAVRQLRSAVDAVREIGRVLEENIESVEMDGVPFIHPDNWPQVRAEVRDLIAQAQDIEDDLTGFIGDDDSDLDNVITVEAEDDDWELPPGSG